MRILVFEYITGGGLLDAPLTPSLVTEGDLMRRALIANLAELPEIQLVTTRDYRVPAAGLGAEVRWLHSRHEFEAQWSSILNEVDAVWPIAPETRGILENISRNIVMANQVLLNSRPTAISVAASKSKTTRHLAGCGIPVVPTLRLNEEPCWKNNKWVIKPDDGVGCEHTFLCRNGNDLKHWLEEIDDVTHYILQSYMEGVHASLSMLCRDGKARLLSCNLQNVDIQDGRFHLRGCVVNGLEDAHGEYESLAGKIAAALPDLWGYVGVDLIETTDGPRVLEINPRLTTSYAGLRAALGANPAAMVLDLLEGSGEPAHHSFERNRVHIALGCLHAA